MQRCTKQDSSCPSRNLCSEYFSSTGDSLRSTKEHASSQLVSQRCAAAECMLRDIEGTLDAPIWRRFPPGAKEISGLNDTTVQPAVISQQASACVGFGLATVVACVSSLAQGLLSYECNSLYSLSKEGLQCRIVSMLCML